jgi:hypothetical protein
VRERARSRERLAHIFSTAGQASAVTSRGAVERSAAIATERASLASFLPVFPDSSSRTRAASLGCTSTTRSPAATSCWASSLPRPSAASTAQVRSGQSCAQATSCSACDARALTRTWPSSSSAGPAAATVCEALCGPAPIITTAITAPCCRHRGQEKPWRACLIPDPGIRSSYEPHHGEAPAGWQIVRKPGHKRGRQRI